MSNVRQGGVRTERPEEIVIRSLPARLWRVAVRVDRTEEESVHENGDESG
jgi:hypothetical protein